MSSYKVLFQMTGSIAAYKACSAISALVKAGHEVEVVCSPSTFNFVGKATLEGLTGRPVHTDQFKEGAVMEHIQLARWADVAVLAPATANTINKLAAGIADDLIGTLFLAYDRSKPYLVAPAMNTVMYNHPVVQSSLDTLRNWGIKVLPTNAGQLACGEVGEGKLIEPDELVDAITNSQEPNWRKSRARVLVTAGGTKEYIDGVRFISNISSGQTGAELADLFYSKDFDVSYIKAKGAAAPRAQVRTVVFETFDELDRAIKNELNHSHFDAVIHLAAVSDFVPEWVEQDGQRRRPGRDVKMPSDSEITIQMKKTFKIVNRLKDYSLNPDIKVIAFKLTNSTESKVRVDAVKRLFSPAIDLVVHNDLNEITYGRHPFTVYNRALSHVPCKTTSDLAICLDEFIAPEMAGNSTSKHLLKGAIDDTLS